MFFHTSNRILPALLCASLCLVAACTWTADEEDLVAVTEPVVCDAPDVRLAYISPDYDLVIEDLCAEGRTPTVTRVEIPLPMTDAVGTADRVVWSDDGRYLGVVSSWVNHFSVSSVLETYFVLGPLPADARLQGRDVGELVEVGGRWTDGRGAELLGVTSGGELRVENGRQVLGFSQEAGTRTLLEYDWRTEVLEVRAGNPRFAALVGSDASSHVYVDLVSLDTGEAATVWSSQELAPGGDVDVIDITVDGGVALQWQAPGDASAVRLVIADDQIRQLDELSLAADAALSPRGTWWEVLREGEDPWQFTHSVDATRVTPAQTPSVYLDQTDSRQLDSSRTEPCSLTEPLETQQPWLAYHRAAWPPDEQRVATSYRHRDETCRAVQLHDIQAHRVVLEHIYETPEWLESSSFYAAKPWDAVVF